MSLDVALNPQSIAIIGASDNPHKVGGRPLMYLLRFGYRGRVYPINAGRETVQGVAAFRHLDLVPETPDLAIVAVPADQAADAVAQCATRGVKVAIVMASGFGETADPAARAAQRQMVANARAAGMRIVGPNSQGLANFGTGVVASFSTMFLEVEPADGPVAIVSQSGVMSVVPYALLRRRGIGVRHSHATGNNSDVTLAELALAVVRDPAVRLVLLYMESMDDAATLAEAAQIARERDVPIVAVKSGRTSRAQAAAQSHTGALATDDGVVEAFFRAHGIWRARDIEDLCRAAELYLTSPRPRGNRLVVISNSGASGVLAADAAHDAGLPLTDLSASTTRAMAAELPAFASVANPIDITAALLTNSNLFGALLPHLADEPSADLFLVSLPVAGQGYDVAAFARDAADFAARCRKPVAIAAPQDDIAAQFRAAGLPTFSSETTAVAALAQLAHHTALMQRPRVNDVPSIAVPVPAGSSRSLNEAESLALLAQCGLPVVPHRLCRAEDDVVEAFRSFDAPVAVKGCSADVPHKSDHGLVVLNVASESAAIAAFHTIDARLTALGARNEGVIVAPMVDARREIALGARRDPVCGPVVMIADGGRYVESLRDIVLLMPPFDEQDARDALRRLRIAPLFDGVRGETALDAGALCAVAVQLGHIITSAAGEITSIDVNPLMVGPAGAGVMVADALIERSPGPQNKNRPPS